MAKLNIYIVTTAKSIGRQKVGGLFLIELITDTGTYTTTLGAKGTYVYSDSSTAQRATVNLLTRALLTLPAILKHVRDKPTEALVWIEENVSGPFMQRWYEKWAEDSYTLSSGKAIANAEQWESLNGAIAKSGLRLEYTTAFHTYKNAMLTEAVKLPYPETRKH